jgi:NAD(P)-dependent dehydrogenase (short-subunit alcohol dehydrogenase family)
VGLSKEVAEYGIRVNAVRPGLIETAMHSHAGDAARPEKLKQAIPMRRAGQSDEVASAILWLLSDSASYVTGALVDVSGGR